MLPIKHILFPVDFSDRCLAVAPFVAAMARRFGAKVIMLSAAPPLTYTGMAEAGATYYIAPEDLRADVQSRLDSALVKEFAALPVTRIAEVGDPATVIVCYARTRAVDLIMMPTHGYGPFRRLLLGSVTAKVLHDAECPVWTGAHMEAPPEPAPFAPRTILCAVDRSDKAATLMRWAAQLSGDTGASLRLMHVIPGGDAFPERQLDAEFEQFLRERAREEFARIQTSAGVDAPLCIGAGDVADAVREEARRHHADLIVIGRGVIHETLGRLRTHAHSIIRHAPCPVISV